MWNETRLTIGLGDIVKWSWSLPSTISGINIKVEQVADAASTEPVGFSSGIPKPSGK